jgi:hypothetical protein
MSHLGVRDFACRAGATGQRASPVPAWARAAWA